MLTEAATRYLDLLEGCLTRDLFLDEEVRDVDLRAEGVDDLRPMLRERGWRLVRRGADPVARAFGRDWPPHAETMIGRARLGNVRSCTLRALADGVPGDLVEAGVWRGGTAIFLRALLAAAGDGDGGGAGRRVWACDSFEGLPVATHELDVPMRFHEYPQLAIGLDVVQANFARYGLLDDRVRFVPGWFRDTLPGVAAELRAAGQGIAVLRLDGDLYESTMDALAALEPLVSPGGFVLVDDHGGIEACAAAVADYRASAGITERIEPVDWTGVFWRKMAR